MAVSETLILNSGFIPVRIASVEDAINLLYLKKAYPVIETENVYHSAFLSIRVPSVLALFTYDHLHISKVFFTRLNVLYRDDLICQFCGKRFSVKDLTVDHLIPRSRWGEVYPNRDRRELNSWFNVVAACKWCNTKKGNLLLSELGWKLKKKPEEPKYLPRLIISYNRAEKNGWLPFCNINIKLVYTT